MSLTNLMEFKKEDQVLLRNLLELYIPSDVKLRIREKFNEEMNMRYNLRCIDLGIVKEAT